ncbi:hypothetical protein ACQJBY_060426 [Aegilops geniculata]
MHVCGGPWLTDASCAHRACLTSVYGWREEMEWQNILRALGASSFSFPLWLSPISLTYYCRRRLLSVSDAAPTKITAPLVLRYRGTSHILR